MKFKISESVLKRIINEAINEVVYADGGKLNNKNKTIGLTYSKGSNYAKGNVNTTDRLGTDKMDSNDDSTYEVPLKGGIISYNITDIKGTEIMHYFKKHWASKQRVSMNVIDGEGKKDEYELKMEDSEERAFINRFVEKIQYVINSWINKNKKNDVNFSRICILPVDSSSNFNKKFVGEELTKLKINNLDVNMVNPNMIIKDISNLQRDIDFINKNKDYYNSEFIVNKPKMGTVIQNVDSVINKYESMKTIGKYVEKINEIASNILLYYYQHNQIPLTEYKLKKLVLLYKNYVDLIRKCYKVTYHDVPTGKDSKMYNTIGYKKYNKPASIDERSKIIWDLVKSYFRGQTSDVDGKKYEEMKICEWKVSDFEIKKLRNPERLALKNMYQVNSEWTPEEVQKELEKIKGSIFLIFDDNVSGGATLSDVCYQCKKLGIENIIPITFGKMNQSNSMRGLVVNTPKNNSYNFS